MNKRTLWITETAICVALLVVLQAVTAPLGNQIVTGSINNFMFIIAVMTCGLSSGLTVAVISPIVAKFIGIGPFWALIPFIILGNIVLVALWHLIANRSFGPKYVPYIVALVAAAVSKFAVLFIGVGKVAVPFILGLPEPQASVISGMFSIPQIFTASIGGVLAIILLPALKKALNKRPELA